ncbi:hypothetical protein T484DRAFT_3545837 [Baffinella frigidus]|nr:hypothetical protein T484DRAFT_3545837 [Cryptophyta sp. CCMP2293]
MCVRLNDQRRCPPVQTLPIERGGGGTFGNICWNCGSYQRCCIDWWCSKDWRCWMDWRFLRDRRCCRDWSIWRYCRYSRFWFWRGWQDLERELGKLRVLAPEVVRIARQGFRVYGLGFRGGEGAALEGGLLIEAGGRTWRGKLGSSTCSYFLEGTTSGTTTTPSPKPYTPNPK